MKPILLLSSVALFASIGNANTIVVDPTNMGNWTVTNSDSSVNLSFVSGPATPPLGIGSAQFQIGADGNQYIIMRDDADISGTALSALTQLSYSTYEQQYLDGQAVYLSLVLSNGDRLYFEPVYQTGGYSGDTVPDQCVGITNCAGLNQWHNWNALAGGWWDANGFKASNGGPPVFTLADYAAANAGVTISAVRLLAGGGAGAWDNFKGNADNLTFATANTSMTFNFEPSLPEPSSLAAFGLMLAGLGIWRRRTI